MVWHCRSGRYSLAMRSLAQAQDRAELLARLKQLRPDASALWGKMNAHQAVCHLSDGFRAALAEKSVKPLSNRVTQTLVKWGAFYMPMRWPKNVQTMPEVDQLQGGTRPVEFEQDRAELLALIERFVAMPAAQRPAHPLFGPLSEREWLRWGYLHCDHHLRQFGV